MGSSRLDPAVEEEARIVGNGNEGADRGERRRAKSALARPGGRRRAELAAGLSGDMGGAVTVQAGYWR